MTHQELKSTLILASVYGLRMFGMFILLPIFAVYASNLSNAPTATQIGLALGIYGLTQALLQIPFGVASDFFGRKPMIYVGLFLLVIGSLIAGASDQIEYIILGRAIQGSGAISAVLTAYLSDLTSPAQRTKSMAIVGASIGLTFLLSLILAPVLNHKIGVPGIFMMIALLSLMAMFIVRFFLPELTIKPKSRLIDKVAFKNILLRFDLQQLNFGIFALHACQIAMFMIVPFYLINQGGIELSAHWTIYFPILMISFVIIFPIIIFTEKFKKTKTTFLLSIGILILAQFLFIFISQDLFGVLLALTLFFIGFNFLEATLPSLVSKMAPDYEKGLALGVYNTSQSFGIFVGGIVGGLLNKFYSYDATFIFCIGILVAWFLLSLRMQVPKIKS